MNLIKFFSKKYKYKRCPIIWDRDETLEEFLNNSVGRDIEYNLNRNFWNIVEDVTEDISHAWRYSIKYPLLSIKDGLYNFYKYRKVIYNDRWWDSYYLTEWQYAKLQDMYNNWDRAIYLESEKEKDIILELLGYLDIMKDSDSSNEAQSIAKEKYFKLLSDNYEKFWD